MQSKKGRWWVFAIEPYAPRGGMEDFKFSFNTVEDFEREINGMIGKYASFQVLDIETHYHFQGDFGTVVKWVCKNVGDEDYE
jgi:hypothetical protein